MKRSAVLPTTLVALAAGAAVLAGCAGPAPAAAPAPHSSAAAAAPARPALAVTGAYVRQPATPDMAAGYFVVTDTGQAPDRLLGVTADIAAKTTMHRTTAAGAMVPVPYFAIPAGGRLVLSVGGNHLMLMGLKRKPVAGDTVTFHLRFAHSAPITVRAPVRPTSYQPAG